MINIGKSKQLTITQAKKIGTDGKITYYLSKPEIKLFDIKGRLWVWRRVRALKKERIK